MNTSERQNRATLEDTFDELRKSERRLRVFIDMVPALAWCVLPDGSPEFLNQQCHTYTGLSSEELQGSGWEAVVHPDDREQLRNRWRDLLQSGEAGEMEARLRRFDGEYRWFLIRAVPVHDEQGNVVRWYGIGSDIDDRKRAEDRVRQDETELRRITDAIPQSITVLAPYGTALYANRVALDETGLTPEEVRAHGFFSRAFHPDDVDRVQAERRAGSRSNWKCARCRKAGSIAGVSSSTIRSATNRAGSYAGMRRELTSKIRRKPKRGSGTRIWFYARKSIAPRCSRKLSVLPNRCARC
jgi:PAS domain S-box-containing protein